MRTSRLTHWLIVAPLWLVLASELGGCAEGAAPGSSYDRPCANAEDTGGITRWDGGTATCECNGVPTGNVPCDIPSPDTFPIPPPPGVVVDPRVTAVVATFAFSQEAMGQAEASLDEVEQFVGDVDVVAVTPLAATAEDEGMGKLDPKGDGNISGTPQDKDGDFDPSKSGNRNGGGLGGAIQAPDGLGRLKVDDAETTAEGDATHKKEGENEDGEGSGASYATGGGKGRAGNGDPGNDAIDRASIRAYVGPGSANAKTGEDHSGDLGARDVSPMNGEDPEDYFSRIPRNKSLFEIIEERYRSETRSWPTQALP